MSTYYQRKADSSRKKYAEILDKLTREVFTPLGLTVTKTGFGYGYLSIEAGKERLGSIEINTYELPTRYKLTGKRIPSRASWRDGGTKTFKKYDSLVKAINQYMIPTSEDEVLLKEAIEAQTKAYRRVSDKQQRVFIMIKRVTNQSGYALLDMDPAELTAKLDRARLWRKVNDRMHPVYQHYMARFHNEVARLEKLVKS